MLSMLAGLLLLPVILSAVSAAQYGLWLVLFSVATLLYYSDLGMGAAILHFSSRIRGGGETCESGELLSAGLLWNLSAALAITPVYFLLGSLYLASHSDPVGLSETERTALLICGTAMVAGLVVRPFSPALAGAGYLPVERRNQGVALIFRVVATPLVCWLTPSIVAIAAVETFAAILPHALSGITLAVLDQHTIRWGRSTIETLKYMLSYSLRAFVSSFTESALLQGGTIAAGVFAAPADATFFSAAFRIYSSARQLLNWIIDPLRPGLSRLYAIDRSGGDTVVHALSRVLLSGSVIGGTALALGGHALIGIWLGSTVPVTLVSATSAVLLFGLVLNSIHLPLAAGAFSLGRPAVFIVPQIIWLLAFLVLVKPLSSNWGIIGIAAAFAGPLFLVEPLYLLIARNALGFSLGRWLTSDVMPVVCPVLTGTFAASVFVVATEGIRTALGSLLAMLIFVAGVALIFLVRPSAVPVESVRMILRTEL